MIIQCKTQNAKRRTSVQSSKLLVLSLSFALCAFNFTLCFAQEAAKQPSSGELIVKSWEAHGKKNVEETFGYTQQLIDLYQDEADNQQASLSALPKGKDDIEAMAALNDVGTAYFIQGESYRDQGKVDESVEAFKVVVDRFPYSQAWDPRGWYWQIAKASKESIIKLKPDMYQDEPVEVEEERTQVSQLPTKIVLYDPGKEEFVNYKRYGKFLNVGTKDYRYQIKDQVGLSEAVGEGIHPNTTSIRWDPEYKKAIKEGRLEGDHWDFVYSPDLEAAFLKWATAPEPTGVKMFYTALMLEKSGLIEQAIKCYYAIVVHYPGSYGWTYWQTPWYPGQAAVYKIEHLLKQHPELGHRLVGADVKIVNGFDNDVSNDLIITNPGKFEKVSCWDKIKSKFSRDTTKIKTQRGKGRVHLVQYENDDWQLIVDGEPFEIRAVTYAPTMIGESPDAQTLTNWMENDFNQNGIIDGPYEAFVDKNGNNLQDKEEVTLGDFQLMKDMGVNAIRLYHQPFALDKLLLRELYDKYGIMVIMGDFFGKYALGSGAPWNPGTDYNNQEHKKNMLDSALGMVKEFKDEPYVLLWLLGNENVYGYACNADKEPQAFYEFVNEVAKEIKKVDPDHPVAVGGGDTLYLDVYGKYSPEIDIYGTNSYRGDYGFGRLWQGAKEESGKPVLVTEFGCPAFVEGKSRQEAEELQAAYHRAAWENIEDNMAFGTGSGNSVGGVIFEWLDEWWKQYEPFTHDERGVAQGPFPDGYFHEEWFGICGQGNGKYSPFMRHLRKAYFLYQKIWR